VQVLRELITHAGSVVPREQLIALLWPQGVVDFDTGLNTVIRKLRSALGDTSETPRYIETLPRRGYRFIGALDSDPEGAPAAMPVPPSHHDPMVLPEAALAEPKSMASGPEPVARDGATSSTATTTTAVRRPRLTALTLIAALAVAALLTGVYALWRVRSGASVTSVRVEAPSRLERPATATSTSAVAFSPPPHSIAVLPFVNISGDKEQEYFSDGLTEELLSSLTRLTTLQVAAQTSSFYFKGKDVDLGTIARKLNVGAVLEGSVRRSRQRVRITAQLINAVTGFQLWSQTYDRDVGEVLSLQTEIANAVANALEITLLADAAARIELGGTRNPAAFDAYLRGLKGYSTLHNRGPLQSAIDAYSEAIRLDPNYALAFAGRAMALCEYTDSWGGLARPAGYDRALQDARRAIALAPALGEAHLALARVLKSTLDFEQAAEEYASTLALVPGSAAALQAYGAFAVFMGHTEEGLSALSRAVVLDPLSPGSHYYLGEARWIARRYSEAVLAFDEVISLDPDSERAYGFRGFAYYGLGELQHALMSCAPAHSWTRYVCLALTYQKLGKRAEAQAMLAEYQAVGGDAAAYQYAEIYAQWGNVAKALECLDTAVRMRDPGFALLKRDPLLDPLRKEPRFQAIERELKFPPQ